MKSQPIALALLAGIFTVVAQEPAPGWDVEIPPLVVVEAPAKPAEEPAPIEFEVLSSNTKKVFVSEAPEMADLPPVEGIIKVTVERVADPGLPDLTQPLPALSPTDPEVIARLQELKKTYRGSELVFLSASVHQAHKDAGEARTLVEIYPNGKVGKKVAAWTNLNLLHLTGHGLYRVNSEDGTYKDYSILMGISPIYGDMRQRMAARVGREVEEPHIPALPALATAGPSFALVEGDVESPAFDTLEQIHDLFRKSGDVLKEQYLAREQARQERKAFLLANPEEPKDVTIRVWRRSANNSQMEGSR